MQAKVPATHGCVAPDGFGFGTMQGPTASAGGRAPVLSMFPSQSSSWPLQVSGFGSTAPTQTSVPFWHTLAPNEQGKMLLTPQLPPTSVGLSSTTPSQSSSFPLQVSSI